mmetsp:Transcript_44072/g.101712  ORF Transcript_44072/g.101712 Transcript_44072/m.101712 type:complete len:360 (-) Transcript_44072:35-1114(-)
MPAPLRARGEPDEEDWGPSDKGVNGVSTVAFMEDLCLAAGGYARFFRRMLYQYFGWHVAIVLLPALFLDHHRCETLLPLAAWVLYIACVAAMISMAVLFELSLVQSMGLLKDADLVSIVSDRRWQMQLLATVLLKLDTYTDVTFIFISRDCGSSLWMASLAAFCFSVLVGRLLLMTCFACTDCDKELPPSFGFFLLDFKLVNAAVRNVLPFDPDASDLPMARPVTLRTTGHLLGFEKVMGDIAQVLIQFLFLNSIEAPHGFIYFSVICGILHGSLALAVVLRECLQEGWSSQASGLAGLQLKESQSMPFSNMVTPQDGESSHVRGHHMPDATHGLDSPRQSGRDAGRSQHTPEEIPELL